MKIAVDVQALRPGGENGGAKVLLGTLLERMVALDSADQFLLCSAPWNTDEMLMYAGPRVDVVEAPGHSVGSMGFVRRVARKLARRTRRSPAPGWLRARGAELLFCPFTDIGLAEPGVPAVSLAHDIQHRDLPENFSDEERRHRDAYWSRVAARADLLICVSAFTRDSLQRHLGIEGERMRVVHTAIHDRWQGLPSEPFAEQLRAFGVEGMRYLIYPANFWPHKNHHRLLQALQRYLASTPDSPLHLVLTGALEGPAARLRREADALGIAGRVHFLGFVEETELAALWDSAHGCVFPSTYEGFGIPVVEAMSFGVPLACSRAGSLPEVAADAAEWFDPMDLASIAAALGVLDSDDRRRDELARLARERVAHFRGDRMAREYLHCFESAIAAGTR